MDEKDKMWPSGLLIELIIKNHSQIRHAHSVQCMVPSFKEKAVSKKFSMSSPGSFWCKTFKVTECISSVEIFRAFVNSNASIIRLHYKKNYGST